MTTAVLQIEIDSSAVETQVAQLEERLGRLTGVGVPVNLNPKVAELKQHLANQSLEATVSLLVDDSKLDEINVPAEKKIVLIGDDEKLKKSINVALGKDGKGHTLKIDTHEAQTNIRSAVAEALAFTELDVRVVGLTPKIQEQIKKGQVDLSLGVRGLADSIQEILKSKFDVTVEQVGLRASIEAALKGEHTIPVSVVLKPKAVEDALSGKHTLHVSKITGVEELAKAALGGSQSLSVDSISNLETALKAVLSEKGHTASITVDADVLRNSIKEALATPVPSNIIDVASLTAAVRAAVSAGLEGAQTVRVSVITDTAPAVSAARMAAMSLADVPPAPANAPRTAAQAVADTARPVADDVRPPAANVEDAVRPVADTLPDAVRRIPTVTGADRARMAAEARAAEEASEGPAEGAPRRRKTGRMSRGESVSLRNPVTGETMRVSNTRPLAEGEYTTLRQAIIQDSTVRLAEQKQGRELQQSQQWANAAFRNRENAKAFDARVAMAQVRSAGAFEEEGQETLAGMAKRVRLAKEVRDYLEASPDKKDAAVRASQKWDARTLIDAGDENFLGLRDKLETLKRQKASVADAGLNAKFAPRAGEAEVKTLSRQIDIIDAGRRFMDNGMTVPEAADRVGTRAISGVGDLEALIARRDDLAREAQVARASAKNAVRFNVKGSKEELAFAKSQLDSALRAGWLKERGFEQEARVAYGDDALKADAVALAERVRQIESGIEALKKSEAASRRSARAEERVQEQIKANEPRNASAFAAPQLGDDLGGQKGRLVNQIRMASLAQDLAARGSVDLARARFGEEALRADVEALRGKLAEVDKQLDTDRQASRAQKRVEQAAARVQQRIVDGAPDRATAFDAPEFGYDLEGQRARLQRQVRMSAVAQGLMFRGDKAQAEAKYGSQALEADVNALREQLASVNRAIEVNRENTRAQVKAGQAEERVRNRIEERAPASSVAYAAPWLPDTLDGNRSRTQAQIKLASSAQALRALGDEDGARIKYGAEALEADVDALRKRLARLDAEIDARSQARREDERRRREAEKASAKVNDRSAENAVAWSAQEYGYDEDGQRQRLQRQIRRATVAQGLSGRGELEKARTKYGDDALAASIPSLREQLRSIDRGREALAEAARQAVLRTQFEAPDLDPLKRLERQIQLTTRAYALMELGQEKAARAKYGDAAVDAHLPTLQGSLREEQERKVRAEHATGAVRAQARFDAKAWRSSDGRAYSSQGIDIAEAKALVDRFGETQARASLGNKSFLVDLIPQLDTFTGKSADAERAGQKFNRMLWDGHSAARGLAGAMNQMWLTWGSTIPMVAGAALGGALRSVFENGKEVEYQLTFVAALANEARASIQDLSAASGQSMVGPKEASEAMRALAQNGLNTTQALAALPEVLRLATVGEMNLADAALGATGVMEAFGLGVADLGRVGDVFAKAAAVSNTSVGSMVEAMKQASTVSDHYGMSLEETAATLAVLAKRNIEGSAAGTAVRNMMNELATPTKAAKEAIDALGIQIFDGKGKLKGYVDILREVRDKTEGLNEQSRLAYIDRIFGERGGKAANALLGDLDAFEEKLKEIEKGSEGFTKSVEAMLAATTDGRVKRMVAEFQTATSEAFNGKESGAKGAIDDLVLSLTDVFASQEFRESAEDLARALAMVGQGFVNVTAFLVEHGQVLTAGAGLLATYIAASKGAGLANMALGGAVEMLTNRLHNQRMAAAAAAAASTTSGAASASASNLVTVANNASAAAANSAAAAVNTSTAAKGAAAGAAARLVTGLNLVQGALGWVGVATTVLVTGYNLLKHETDETTKSVQRLNEELERQLKAGDTQYKKGQDHLKFLNERNALLDKGLDLEKANAQAGGNGGLKTAHEQMVAAQGEANAAVAAYEALKKKYPNPGLREQPLLRQAQEKAEALTSNASNLAQAYGQAKAKHEQGKAIAWAEARPHQDEQLKKLNNDIERYAKQNPAALKLKLDAGESRREPQDFNKLLKETQEKLDEMKESRALPTNGPKPSTIAAAQAARATAQAEQDRVRAELRLLEESQKSKEDILKRDRARGETDEVGYQQRLFAIQRDGLMQRVNYMEQAQKPQMLAMSHLMRGNVQPGWGMVEKLRTAYADGRETGDMIGAFMPLVKGDTEKARRANADALLDIYRKQEEALGRIAATRVNLATLEAEGTLNIADAVRRTDEKNDKAEEKVLTGLASVEGPKKSEDDGDFSVDKLFVSSEERTRASILRLNRSIADARAAVDKSVLATIADVRELRKTLEAQLKGADADFAAANKEAERYEELASKASGVTADTLRAKAVEWRERALSSAERSEAVTARMERLPTEESIRKKGEARKSGIELEKRASVVDTYLNAKTPGGTEHLGKEDKALGQATEAMQSMLALYARYQDAVIAAKDNEIELAAVRSKSMKDGLAGSATMLSSLRAFTSEGTSAYVHMYKAERALRTAQMAFTLKDYATKGLLMAGNVAAHIVGETTKTGATVAGEAARTAVTTSEEALRNLAKVPGVFMTYLSQMGPMGWAAAAATIAMLGLAGVGGGGGSFDTNTDDTGSVLGDKKAKSESITKSIDRLAEVDTMTMRYSAEMLSSLRNIEASFAGVSSLLFRNGGIEAAMPSIRSGYVEPKGLQSVLSTAMGAIASIGSVLGLGSLISRVSNSLFGTKVSVKGQGIAIGADNLANMVQYGINGSYFSDVETKRKLIGITTNKSNKTVYSVMDEEMSSQFNKIVRGFYDTLTTAAPLLGKSVADVMQRLAQTEFGGLKVNLKDKTGDEVTEILNNQFSKIGDTMARSVLPGLEGFSKVGEGYLETTIRVATGLEAAKGALRSLGIQAVALSDVVNKMGEVDTEVVRQSIGNVESVGGALTSIGQIIKNFEGTGTEVAEAYKQLKNVQISLQALGLAATSVSYELIQGAGGLDNLMSGLSAYEENYLTDGEKLQAQASRMRAEFNRLGLVMPKTNADFRKLVEAMGNAGKVDEYLLGQVLGLSDGFYQMSSALEELGSSVEEEIKRIRNLLVMDSTNSHAALQAKFAITTAKARSGDAGALDELAKISQDLLSVAAKQASSSRDLARERAEVAASMEATLAIARSNVGNVTITSPASTEATNSQAVADAVSQLVQGKISLTDFIQVTRASAFANGGYHGGGWRLVGENGPELESTGAAMYYTAAETQDILSGGRANGGVGEDLALAVEALRKEVAGLRADSERQAAAIAGGVSKVARTLQQAMPDGDSLQVKMA